MKLKDYLTKLFADKESGLRQSHVSKKAGISPSMMHKILSGDIKNPSMETLVRIADVLETSLDELVGRKREYLQNKQSTDLSLNEDLLEDIASTLKTFIKKNDLKKIMFDEAIEIIYEVYEYCMEKNNGTLNKDFTEWFLEKSLKNA
ncbi:MAG: helix-turn-helix transcriptional regulator [Rickettsiales bacterium]